MGRSAHLDRLRGALTHWQAAGRASDVLVPSAGFEQPLGAAGNGGIHAAFIGVVLERNLRDERAG